MSHYEKNSRDVPPYIPILAGGFSGVVTRCICHPLDVVKIRFQLQVEPITKGSVESKYTSITQAIKLIVREEGLLALWKGHVPAQLLSLTYGVVQFGSYEALVKEAKHYPTLANNKAKVDFACGMAAGCLATVASSPFDIVRTRLILQGKNRVYKNTLHGLKHILQHEGFRGWFKGLTPTLIQIGPLSGLHFAIFHFYKRLFKEFESKNEINSRWFSMSGTAVAGSLAGFSAKFLTYPLDLFRKRLQFQGFQEARKGFGKDTKFLVMEKDSNALSPLEQEHFVIMYQSICERKANPPTAKLLVEYLHSGMEDSDYGQVVCDTIIEKATRPDEPLNQDQFLELLRKVVTSVHTWDRLWTFNMAVNVRIMEMILGAAYMEEK